MDTIHATMLLAIFAVPLFLAIIGECVLYVSAHRSDRIGGN